MKSFARKFLPGTLIHCYQNTVNGFLLFYNHSDHLVHFTIFCTCAKRYGIRVLAICQMADHIHSGVQAPSREALSLFNQEVSSKYAFSDSSVCKRKGHLFNRPFGSALKQGSKKVRTNLIYIGNNPVERQLCSKAIDYRWNFLAYADNDHPFSRKLVVRKASWAMRKAIKEVNAQHRRNQPLSYTLLQRLFGSLDREEGLQLIDYIVTTYSVIDYEYASHFFGGYGNMIGAMEYNTGSEYDIKEDNFGKSDACYGHIARWLYDNLNISDIHEVFSLPESLRTGLLMEMHSELGTEIRQLAKYLRLKIEYKK